MRFLKAETFRKMDSYCIEELKLPELVLMENAALKLVKNLEADKNSIAVVCGHGNNGGDGFAAARHLFALNKTVKVFFVGVLNKMSKSCKINYNVLKNMGVQITNITSMEDISEFEQEILKSDVTIDALFGTGLSRPVEGIYESVISAINEKSHYVMSIDVPSGLNSDTGTVMGISVKSNKTVTFQAYKEGFLNYEAEAYTGEVAVENIGIPEFVMDKCCEKNFILDRALIKDSLIRRNKYAHKGDFGRLLIFAGSKGYAGAAYICTEAAVKSGTGLTTLCCPENIMPVMGSRLTEAMTVSDNDKAKAAEIIKRCSAIAIGPGIGIGEDTFGKLQYILSEARCPVVIDADGLNALSHDLTILKEKKVPVVITPHLGEMARLTKFPIDYIKDNRIKVAEDFARKYEVVVLLKGYNTIITDGTTVMINPTGSSAIASGGMGDCLTGIIAAFLAGGQNCLTAAFCAAFVHGYSGDKLAENMYSVTASQMLEQIPYTIKELQN